MNRPVFTYTETLIDTPNGVVQLHAIHRDDRDLTTARIYTDTQTDAIRVCDLFNGVGNIERTLNLLKQ